MDIEFESENVNQKLEQREINGFLFAKYDGDFNIKGKKFRLSIKEVHVKRSGEKKIKFKIK